MGRPALISEFLLALLYTMAVGVVAAQVLGMEGAASALFLLSFVAVFGLWLLGALSSMSRADFLGIVTAAVAFLCVIINLLMSRTAPSFGILKKYIFFVAAILYLQTASKLSISEGLKSYLRRLVTGTVLFLILLFFLKGREMRLFNGQITDYLTFRFSNPNLTAMFLSCFYMLETAQLFQRGKSRVLHLLLSGCLLYFIWETGARNALLALLIYWILLLFALIPVGKLRFNRLFSGIFAALPLLFVAAYMLLVRSKWVQNLFAFLVSEGKDLSSRYKLWAKALELFAGSPLFGAYSQIAESSQLHNSHLDVLAAYGVVVWLLFAAVLYLLIYRKGRIYENRQAFAYQAGFVSALALGLGEAAIFNGGQGIYLFVGLFLLLAAPEAEAGWHFKWK